MKETSVDKKAYKEALARLREQYHEELEKNLKVLLGIRDDAKAAANVKVDAVRYANQMLGLPRTAQEKPAEPSHDPSRDTPKELELRPELLAELDELTPKH